MCRASSVEPRQVRISGLDVLEQAVTSVGQSSDLVRLASRVDTAVLVSALEGDDPLMRRSALSLVPYVDRPAAFLPVLVELAASRDRDEASRAASAAARLASDLDTRSARGCADAQCDLVELGGPMSEALRTVLSTPGVGPDIRRHILALLTTDAGRPYVEHVKEEVIGLLDDPDPRVRAAAATLMTPPQDEDVLEALLDAAGRDEDATAAVTCLVAACAAMGLPEGQRHERTFGKRITRLLDDLQPAEEVTAPLSACMAGLSTPWANEQASRLGAGGAP